MKKEKIISLTNENTWNNLWSNYKQNNKVLFSDLLLKYLKPNSSYDCVEIGCVPGNFLVFMNKRLKYNIFGIDYSDKINLLIDNFKLNGIKKYKIYNEDFLKWKTSKKFDIVCSFGFVEHFNNFGYILRKHISLLNNEGTLVIEYPNFRYFQFIFHRLFDKDNLKLHNLSIMDLNFLKNTLDNNGMEIVYLNYYGTSRLWVEYFHKRSLFSKCLLLPMILFTRCIDYLFNLPNRWFSPYIFCIAKLKDSSI